MSEALEKMGIRFLNNEVPDNWTEENGYGFLSIKSLSNWIIDLKERMLFLANWFE